MGWLFAVAAYLHHGTVQTAPKSVVSMVPWFFDDSRNTGIPGIPYEYDLC